MNVSRLRRLAPLAVLVLAAAACNSGGGGDAGDDTNLSGKTVTVIGTWGGDEQKAFL